MEFKEFEEKAKEYFEETGANLRRERNVFCECVSCNCCCFDNCELDYQQRKDIKNLYTDENVAKLEKYLDGKKMGNFKVRCLDTDIYVQAYTKGKIYEVKDGVFTTDSGGGFRDIKNFTDLCECSSATWELIEDATDINVDSKDEHCLECQPNYKSCNTCFFYEEEESEYPCNTCVSGAGDNEMYVKGAGCHNCGRTFEAENIVNSLNQTITKLENEIAELKEHLKDKDYEITALSDVNIEYRKEIEQLKAQLPEEKTAIDLLNEKETQLIADANKKTLQQEFYKQGYLQGLEDMHRQIREVLRDKGIE